MRIGLNQLNKQKQGFEKEKTDLQKKFDAMQDYLLTLDTENADLKANKQTLQQGVEKLQLSLDRAKTDLELNREEGLDALDKSAGLLEENAELKRELDLVLATLQQNQDDLELRRDEIKTLREDYEGTVTEQKRQILKLAKHYKLSKERLTQAEDQLAEKEKRVQQISQEMSSFEKSSETLHEQEGLLELRLRKMEESLRTAEADALQSRQELLDTQAQNRTLSEKLETHGSDLVRKCQKEVEHYQEHFQVMQSKFTDQKNSNQRLKEEKRATIQVLTDIFDTLNQTIYAIGAEQTVTPTSKEEISSLLEAPEKCSQHAQKMIKAFGDHIQNLSEEKAQEHVDAEESRRESRRLAEEIETTSRGNEELQRHFEEVQKKIDASDAEVQKRGDRIKELQALLESAQEHNRFQEAQITELQQSTEVNSEAKSEISSELNRVQENYKRELEKIRGELVHEKKQLEETKQERDRLNDLSEGAHRDLHEKTVELEQVKKRSLANEERFKEICTQLASTKSQVQIKETDLEKAVDDLKSLETKLESLESILKTRDADLERNTLELSKKDAELRNRENELERIKGASEGERSELEESRQEIKRLENVEALVRDQLRAAKEILQTQAAALTDELNLTRKKVEILEEEKLEAGRQFEGERSSHQAVEKEIHLIKQGLARGVREAKEVESRYFDALEEKFQVVGRYKVLMQKHKEQSQHLQTVISEAQRLKKENTDLHHSAKEFDILLEEAQGEIEEFQGRASAWESEYEKIVIEKKGLSAKLEDLTREESQARESIRILEEQLEESEETKKSLDETQNDLSKEREEHQAELKSLRSKHESALEEKEVEQKNILASFESLQREHQVLNVKLEEREQKILNICADYESRIALEVEQRETETGKLSSEITQLNQRVNSLTIIESEKVDLQNKHEELVKEYDGVVKRLEQMSGVRQDLDARLDKLSQRYRECQAALHEKTEDLKGAREAGKQLDEKLKESLTANQEGESQLSVLQQHFKRKVKENALQADMLKKQKMEAMSLQNDFTNAQGEVKKLVSSIEMQKAHEEKVQAMTRDTLNVAEQRAKEWQEKYFAVHSKWQDGNMRIKDLEKIQGEYQQVQEFLSKMRHFVGSGMAVPNQQASYLEASSQKSLDHEEASSMPTQNAQKPRQEKQVDAMQGFEAKGGHRSRKTLFDD
ncbi:hypothetical protein SCG7109_AB_00030 [Chlamydiales bacterium SCGC AG-110-M15]|nr:hypothetical protein SCG7109_AB_00030 [Chlamydiales bacterium SCGC AG-110-M15]